ncbi:MAG: LysR family transcriptional regulator [Hungatella sp.]|nr:LysR family transcriptional regulator [Hungatella sp.]
MNTQQLEYVIAIAEEKNLSKAAEKLFVTQPALSQQLKKLEEELETKLFYKDKNNYLLTDAGRIYVNGAQYILSLYSNALKEIENLNYVGKKRLTIIYRNDMLPVISKEVLPALAELHENIFIDTIDADGSVAKDYVMNGMADLAVMVTKELSHSMLEYIPLRRENLILAVPENHPCLKQLNKHAVDFSWFSDDSFILNPPKSTFRSCENKIFSSHQFTPSILCESNDLTVMKHMVNCYKGIAFLPESVREEEDNYVCLPLTPPAAFYIVIAYRKSSVLSKPVKDLIKLLLKACENT